MCLATTFMRWEGSTRKDGSGIYSSSFLLDDFITLPWTPLYRFLSTAPIVLSSFLTRRSMIQNRLYNASSTIFNKAEASILFDLPSKVFGHSRSSASSPLFYATSHLQNALEYSTISMTPLLIPPMIKVCPLEESYLLLDDLFCQPISYVTVSLTLFFFPCIIEHTSQHMTDCCVLVYPLSREIGRASCDNG